MEMDEIFKANDVRGIYGKELTKELAYKIGRGFASYVKQKEIIVGKDMRISSPILSEAFIQGITDQGKNILDIGCVGTDMLWFSSGFLKSPAAMITASHNPAKYNGIKFCQPSAIPIGEKTGLKEVKRLANSPPPSKTKGKYRTFNLFKDYVKHVHSFVNTKNIRDFKLVVDAGNGMAASTFCPVYSKFKVTIDTLDFKLDGTFPKHVANPSKHENIHDLELEVKKKGADIGMAFDGDTDRVYFVDENGKVLSSSITASIIIKHLLKKKKSPIIYSLVCSKIVPDTIKEHGGKPLMEKVGHTFLKQRMKESSAIFACEHSGHFYYKKNYRADSGMITSLIMCEIMCLEKKPLSEIAKEFKKYSQIEEKSVKVTDKIAMIKKIEKLYIKQKPKKILHKDGTTIIFEDYWFNLRPSNTEPLLRVNLEANDKKLMKEKTSELLRNIKK
ncbi:MAG: phosphomannomutase/phosphoglucomutase [Nanoarchaeota archaeon]|nr:phosphomannomutase/phosphoglucomutase [Nanoarchaeota archaeon]|tara:strand:- start:543 stop:1877 length:1335 start_codon:yes stop_codon:yes gene_type:complete